MRSCFYFYFFVFGHIWGICGAHSWNFFFIFFRTDENFSVLGLFPLFFKGWLNLGDYFGFSLKKLLWVQHQKGCFGLCLVHFLFGHIWGTYLKIFWTHFKTFGNIFFSLSTFEELIWRFFFDTLWNFWGPFFFFFGHIWGTSLV